MTTTPASSPSAPDIRQLRERDLPAGKFPGGAKSDFRIFIDPAAHEQVQRHGRENVGVEICGVLVGRWGRDEKGPFLTVNASIRGEAATNKFAEVTFTHETWSKINARMDKDFVGESIVGWYHTHPDFGIFLSDRDRFIHDHFFNEPGQVAFVVDPVRKLEGVFVWNAGKAVEISHYWVGDSIRIGRGSPDAADEAGGDGRKRLEGADHRARKSTGVRESAPADETRPQIGAITLWLGAFCMLMLGWLLHERLGSSERRQLIEFVQVERLRLNRDLSQAEQSLRAAVTPLETALILYPESFQRAEVRGAVIQASNGLARTAAELEALRRRYAIDEREIGQLASILAQQQAAIETRRRKETPATAPATTQAGAAMGASGSTVAAATPPSTQPSPPLSVPTTTTTR